MSQISLQPEFVTSSGEACVIMLNDQFVGSLTLLYREEDRIWGSVQLDEEVLHEKDKVKIDRFILNYVEDMLDALAVPEGLITVTYSEYDHVITAENEDDLDELDELNEMEEIVPNDYQLTIVRETEHKVEYTVEDHHEQPVASANVYILESDVVGEISWHFEPTDDQINQLTKIFVSDFDQDVIDQVSLIMFYGEEEIATVELTHEDIDENFFDEDEQVIMMSDSVRGEGREDWLHQ